MKKNRPVVCSRCGDDIGFYEIGTDGRTFLAVGNYRMEDSAGWCRNCSHRIYYHSTDAILERMIDTRKRVLKSESGEKK